MANSLLSFLVLLSAIYCGTAQQKVAKTIGQGSSLTPTGNSSWLSPSGLFAFGFYPQGDNRYRVGIFFAGLAVNKTVVWTANRDDPPVSDYVTLRLTTDGRLILQQQSQDSTTDIVNPDQSVSSASMLDTGNFVLYDSNQKKIWQSFDHPTDTILPGQILSKGQELFSSRSESDYSTGLFRLKMQSDSNLVQYPVDATDAPQDAYWNTVTYGIGGVNVTLNLDPDGHLYLLNNSAIIVKNLTDGFPEKQRIYLLKIDPDGILRLYSFPLDRRGRSSSIVWQSSVDRCDPKGICGLNGYCTLYDNEPKCECPPGFNYVSAGNWTAGCERNYSADRCKNNERRIQYSMRSLENTLWEDDPYSVLKLKSTEECKSACLEDCDCEAAFYKDGDCSKQKLPLRYGRRLLSESNIAYIKWAPSTPEKAAPTDSKTKNKKERRLLILLISVSLVALAFTIFLIFGFVAYRKCSWASKRISVNVNFELMEDIAPQSFTYAELVKVTNGFQEEIGRGSSGTVYKGTLDFNNKVVAVKRLENMLADGEKEFQNEMKVIGRTHHQILCCRKSVVLGLSEEEAVLEEWVYQCFENNELAKLVTGLETDMIKFERMVRVGLWCVLDEPSIRPSMKKVLLMLEGTVDIPAPPSLRSYFTAI
ncbi:Receptor-like serine/threonine-protein kinase [Heracleum sosnowskyi]|uniref:non-specific serine/threonine protein kinase n=1 Tax=Heracleum sosnowskyi TaxID=360622 RepID=A0AAD8MG22_9APIA|nr:Receptor-like serine/threonine-protein kinase [Heracleum sosnowskyi]